MRRDCGMRGIGVSPAPKPCIVFSAMRERSARCLPTPLPGRRRNDMNGNEHRAQDT